MARDLSLFPNVSTLASYNSIKQYINLNSVERNELMYGSDERKRDIEKLLAHEVQHYLDSISTIWGRNQLINSYKAIEAYIVNDERHFWLINKIYKELLRSEFNAYYTTKSPQKSSKWKWQLTSGSRFDSQGRLDPEKPILFTRFSDYDDDSFLCRVPLSVSSLLEVNAMAAELDVDAHFISGLNEDTQLVENRLLSNSYLCWIYNTDLSVYSVAAHLTSNLLGFDDVVKTLVISSAISNLALNLPDSFFEKLKIPQKLKGWGSKNQQFIEEKDRGYLYLLLLENYSILYGGEFDMNKLLVASNLPPIDIIEEEIKKCMLTQELEIKNGYYHNKIKKHLRDGYKIFIDSANRNNKWSLVNVLAECDIRLVFGDDLFEDEWDEITDAFYKFMVEFASICGV